MTEGKEEIVNDSLKTIKIKYGNYRWSQQTIEKLEAASGRSVSADGLFSRMREAFEPTLDRDDPNAKWHDALDRILESPVERIGIMQNLEWASKSVADLPPAVKDEWDRKIMKAMIALEVIRKKAGGSEGTLRSRIDELLGDLQRICEISAGTPPDK